MKCHTKTQRKTIQRCNKNQHIFLKYKKKQFINKRFLCQLKRRMLLNYGKPRITIILMHVKNNKNIFYYCYYLLYFYIIRTQLDTVFNYYISKFSASLPHSIIHSFIYYLSQSFIHSFIHFFIPSSILAFIVITFYFISHLK